MSPLNGFGIEKNHMFSPFSSLGDIVTAYPLWSVTDAEGDLSRGWSSWRLGCEVIHGETRQLTSDFKHMELSAGVESKRGDSCVKKI